MLSGYQQSDSVPRSLQVLRLLLRLQLRALWPRRWRVLPLWLGTRHNARHELYRTDKIRCGNTRGVAAFVLARRGGSKGC